MSGLTCPKCGFDHDGKTDSGGWATCRKCANCWQPNPPLSERRPPTSKKMTRLNPWGVSDEYAPEESNDQPRTEPLTVREASGVQKAIPAPGSEPRPRRPSTADAASAPSGDFDSQLFERAERDAQVNRSMQETIAAPNPVPTPSTEGTTTCPVCGHRFSPIGREDLQRCPQCNTLFSLRTGDPVGSGDDYGSDDGDAPDDLIGSTIRGCFVDRKLGEGGMGAVYHARQLSLDRSVAIKVMPTELARNRNFIQRFEREAKSLARINHPNILHIYDFGEDQDHGIYFMIIEFVDGRDLGEVLRTRDAISQAEALDIVRQALLALETASEKGVIHRDIKPDNLMIAKDGTCKVSDFGLAKGYGDFTEVTTAGVRVGTPAFMSPEQCDGGDIDARSDVYSLGCTTFLALTGHLPFNGDSPFSIMLKHKTEAAPSLKKHRADADPRMDALIQRMLAKRPADRCTKLRELIDTVEDLQLSMARASGSPARKSTGDRPRSLDDSGAARLIPDGPAPSAGDDADLPLALRETFGEHSGKHPDLPAIDFGNSAPAPTPAPAAFTAPNPPPVLLNDLPPLPAEGSAQPPTPRPAAGRISTRARSVRGSGELPPPASVTSSSLLHVQQGDDALTTGRPSEAIRQYNEAQKRKPTKEVGGKLAEARKAQRHQDATSLEQHGDNLARAGRYDEAIDDWMRASQQFSQVARREDLLRKVAQAQRAKGRRRLVRAVFVLVLLVALGGAGAYFGTPRLHAQWVEHARQQANAEADPAAKVEALRAILANQRPFAWYVTLFRRDYPLPLAAVETDLEVLNTPPEDRPQPGQTEAERRAELDAKALAAFQIVVDDSAVPLSEVIRQGETTLAALSGAEAQAQATAIIATAREQIEQAEAELAAIAALRAAGQHAAALARAATYATGHPRVDSGSALPVAGRLAISTTPATEGPIEGLRVIVDGVTLEGDPTIFCRDPTRPVVIEITATGYLGERLLVPPGGGDAPVVVQLKPGLLWQATLSPSRPWWRLEPIDGAYLAIGPAAVTVIDPADGSLRQTFERRAVPVAPALPNPTWTSVEQRGTELILASSDGLVVRAERSAEGQFVYKDLLRKGSSAVLGWLERELAYQPGRQTQVVLELAARGTTLTTWSGPTQLWQIPNLDVRVAKPWLSATANRVLVIDDARLRVIDEDGSVPGGYALSGVRTGPVLSLGGGSILAIPTNEGISLLRIGGQPHFVQALPHPTLESAGAMAVAGDEAGLVTGDTLGMVRLYAVENGGLTPRWQTNVPDLRKATGPLALGENVVVVVDDQHHIHLLDRGDGRVLRSYPHPHGIQVAPLPHGDQLIVLDGTGQLTAYQLIR